MPKDNQKLIHKAAAEIQRSKVDQKQMKRSATEFVLAKLSMGLGVEFQELSQGSRDAPAYHGQALLSALPIRSSYVLRFVNQSDFWQPRWYLPNWQTLQRRLGGRMALVVEIEAGGATLVVYNAHLESRENEALRLSQLEEILADTKRHSPAIPLIIAGDFNTNSYESPLIKRLKEEGFSNALGNEAAATNLTGDSRDWVFVRGPIDFENGRVHHEIVASDHYPISVSIHSLPGS